MARYDVVLPECILSLAAATLAGTLHHIHATNTSI